MRGDSLLWSLAAAVPLLSSTVESIKLVKRENPAVIGFDIERFQSAKPIHREILAKRASTKTVGQTIDNQKNLYFCNLTLGNPPQTIRAHLDTGSSDLWVNSANSDLCSNSPSPCTNGGTYDPGSSKSYKLVSHDFNISYVDGSGASGDYVTDTINVGGITMDSFQFAIGFTSSSPLGVLGIGYQSGEVQTTRYHDQPYPNLPAALVKGNYIKSNAYSLWLNDLNANTGQILFGGIDTGKYEGALQTIPILKSAKGGYTSLVIALTGLGIRQGSNGNLKKFNTNPIAVAVDSGSSLSYLPDDLVSVLYDAVGASFDPSNNLAFVPCSQQTNDTQVVFTLSSPTIAVKMNELVIDLGPDSNGKEATFSDGTKACVFGVAPSGKSISILGDSVLRSAYIVYDLDNNQISFANTKFNSTTSEIMEIGVGKDSVPNATGVPDAVTSAQILPTATGVTAHTGSPGARSTSSKAAAAPTLRPDLTIGAAAAGLAGAGMLFAAM